MPRTRRVLLFCLFAFASTLGEAAAQSKDIVVDVTPERIAEAIKMGESDKMPFMRVWLSSGASQYNFDTAVISTPFLRVAMLASAARREYKKFDPATIPAEALAPELHVYALSHFNAHNAANPTTVVITPRKGTPDEKMQRAIHPTRFVEVPVEYQSYFGAEFKGKNMLAVFPLSVLSDENELHVVYDSVLNATPPSGPEPVCRDCKGKFYLKGLR